MAESSDEDLVRRSIQGDKRAFVELVRRHEQPLANLIRYQIGNLDDAQDILQETLLDAWSGLRLLREPSKARVWLLQVARNRCRDFLKSSQRRELATEREELERRINQFGRRLVWRRQLFDDVVDALERAPAAERDIARLFYLEGLTIAEIAARSCCPEGTVKRRLFSARHYARQALGIVSEERMIEMRARKPGSKSQPFPLRRPAIVMTPLDVKPFAVDCSELGGWWIVPTIGSRALAADYSLCDGRLSGVIELRAVRAAEVEGVEGVEIELWEWSSDKGWQPSNSRVFGRLTEHKKQWLASVLGGEKTWLRTFLDEGYVWAWPESDRRIEDTGRFVLQPDGSVVQAPGPEGLDSGGAGVFNVRIGKREFTCLRVFAPELPVTDPHTAVTESYVTEGGRTLFRREYCPCPPLVDVYQDPSKSLTIDGVTLGQFGEESISGLALGIAEDQANSIPHA